MERLPSVDKSSLAEVVNGEEKVSLVLSFCTSRYLFILHKSDILRVTYFLLGGF